MIKNYLFKIILLFVVLSGVFTRASAQYAIGGTADSLAKAVYWLTWNPTAMLSAPSGSDATHIINGTYVWQFSPTVRITAIISNEALSGPSPAMIAYTPGLYAKDGLNVMYSGNNLPEFGGSLGVPNSGMATTNGGTVTFDIDVKIAIKINGTYTDVDYPGMVIGDAESIDSGPTNGSGSSEYISGSAPNAIRWQLLNKRRAGNVIGDDHYKMDISNSGTAFKLYVDLAPGNFGVQAVMFAHGAKELKNISMKGTGITALALGFVLPFDLGDAPLSYGIAGNYIDKFVIVDNFPSDGTYAVINSPTTPLSPKPTVFIGSNNVDPDGNGIFGAAATGDNLSGANDESTITPAALPDIKVNQQGDVVIPSFPVTNTKSVPATVYGWLDFNRDGFFSPDELATAIVPAGSTQNVTLTYPNATFTNKIKSGALYARFRITTAALLDDAATAIDERSTGFASDGETEDYRLKDILGLSISGTVFHDSDGATGGISGTPIQSVSSQPLYAYLIDNTNTIVNKVAVAADGTYVLLNNNSGTYTLAVSVNNIAIGGALSAVTTANLPMGWAPSGESYGVNNAANTGVEAGTPNLQIQVITSGKSQDITDVNFGVEQTPAAANDAGTTTIGQPVTLDVTANDTDPDGTINKTTVLLIDPTDNTKKTSVSIPGQGTYTVNATTGVVTFTPLATFTGKATPLSYVVSDNVGAVSPPALISVIVKPVGVNDKDIAPINTAVATTVKTNDGNSATGTTVAIVTGPAHGTVAVTDANTGVVTYTPTNGYVGTDTYTYTLTTADGVVSDPITVTINIKPVGVNDAVTTPVNTPVKTTVTSNDGPSGVGATVTAGTAPTHGTIVVNADGTITYTPATDYTGNDTYTYTLTKNGVVSDPITVTVAINKPPAATNDAAITTVNTRVTIDILSNDVAGTSPIDPTTVVITQQPAHGTVSVDPTTGKVVYNPATDYSGSDVFMYTVKDQNGNLSNVATVNITINDVPEIGVAKSLVSANRVANGSYDVTYLLTVGNYGKTTLNSLSLTDDLSQTFRGENIKLKSIKALGSLVVNSAYDGSSIIEMLLPSSVLTKGQVEQIQVVVSVSLVVGNATYLNSAVARGTSPLGIVTIDQSTDGVKPDPNVAGDVSPDTPTPVKLEKADQLIPGGFSPNGDGVNDKFIIEGAGTRKMNLEIFNRWGNRVYRSSEYKNDWDGKCTEGLHIGSDVPVGTYYYILKFDDNSRYAGFITITR